MLIQRSIKDAKSARKKVIFGFVVGGDIAGGDDADEKGDVDEGVDGGADGDVDGGDANHGGLVCDGVACRGKAPPPNKSVRREEAEVVTK